MLGGLAKGSDGVMSVVGCCCVGVHYLSDKAYRDYLAFTAQVPDMVIVTVGSKQWRVPRLYVAMHGLKADRVPGLAARFGWAEVKPYG